MSWMAVAGKQRLFLLEILISNEVFITAPPGLLNDYRSALFIWRRIIGHLQKLLPRQTVVINLHFSCVSEARTLEKLGLEKEGDWYVYPGAL